MLNACPSSSLSVIPTRHPKIEKAMLSLSPLAPAAAAQLCRE
jgi:hypothetical protein